jgi:hypothetical protein
MKEIPDLFVTPHAIEQFRQRISPLTDAKARWYIHEGIRLSRNRKLLPDGNTLRIRTRRPFPFEFRAICVFDRERGHWVVTTILHGDSSITRKRKRRAEAAMRIDAPSVADYLLAKEETDG